MHNASATFTSRDVSFDAAAHTSRLPDGRAVPHVTAILRAVRVSRDFDQLGTTSPRVADNIAFASDRGTAVHADCHAYDDDDLDLDAIDPRVRPYVDAWAAARSVLGLEPVVHGRERLVYHPVGYAGILDGVFRRRVGLGPVRTILIDIKTGDPNDAAAHLQTAAYESAWSLEDAVPAIDERWAVWLRPDQRVPYSIIDYTAREDAYMDVQRFFACVTTYYEQPDRRRRIA